MVYCSPMNNTPTNSLPSRETLVALLSAFARQRPGLDFANYGSVSSYRSELRQITKDLQHARTLIRAVELSSITAESLLAAFSAYSGRLSYDAATNSLNYCAGQYFPTEYRKAVCAVCASALWAHVRAYSMPAPTVKQHGKAGEPMRTEHVYDGLSAGDWLRRKFRREFGRGIASRWFN